jgi:hypothetical protein
LTEQQEELGQAEAAAQQEESRQAEAQDALQTELDQAEQQR